MFKSVTHDMNNYPVKAAYLDEECYNVADDEHSCHNRRSNQGVLRANVRLNEASVNDIIECEEGGGGAD